MDGDLKKKQGICIIQLVPCSLGIFEIYKLIEKK